MESHYDVIVVGAGNAALTGAISAAETGANVLVLEKAPKGERGGNTRFTGGLFRVAHKGKPDIMKLVDLPKEEWNQIEIEPYTHDQFYADVMRVTKGLADPNLTNTYIAKSLETVTWMKERAGVTWVLNKNFFDSSLSGIKKLRGAIVIQAEDYGVGLSKMLFAKAGAIPNIEIAYDSMMTGLLQEDGRVTGVKVKAKKQTKNIHAGAVILGSGGFEANEKLRVKYFGKHWKNVKVRGTKHNTGESLFATLRIGAQKFGNFGDAHATPIDARAPDYGLLDADEAAGGTNRISYLFGILVNRLGKRFADEGEDFADYTYAKMGKIVAAQPGGVAYEVFNHTMAGLLEKRYWNMLPLTAFSVEELAKKIHVKPDVLAKEIASFNAAVDLSVPFNPYVRDGRKAKNLAVPRSNWANPLQPPFLIWPVRCGITFTFGGLKVNEKATVLDAEGNPIPGLFATGEITGGFFHHNYAGASGLMRGAVFGKIAGAEAGKSALAQ